MHNALGAALQIYSTLRKINVFGQWMEESIIPNMNNYLLPEDTQVLP